MNAWDPGVPGCTVRWYMGTLVLRFLWCSPNQASLRASPASGWGELQLWAMTPTSFPPRPGAAPELERHCTQRQHDLRRPPANSDRIHDPHTVTRATHKQTVTPPTVKVAHLLWSRRQSSDPDVSGHPGPSRPRTPPREVTMGEPPPAQPRLTPQFCLSTTTLRGALARPCCLARLLAR